MREILMKKTLGILFILIGLTFIYNPKTNIGFVYQNAADFNAIIIVDNDTNVMRYYRGVPYNEEGLENGFPAWLKDKMDKGMPFKSAIIPYKQQFDEKSLPPKSPEMQERMAPEQRVPKSPGKAVK
jgi:hypothetical protein